VVVVVVTAAAVVLVVAVVVVVVAVATAVPASAVVVVIAVIVVVVVAAAVVVVVVAAVAVLAVVYPLVPSVTQAINEASPSHSVARQTLNLPPCFAAFSCSLQNGPFPSLLLSSSTSEFLRVLIERLFFN
jgi:hypothetical protein